MSAPSPVLVALEGEAKRAPTGRVLREMLPVLLPARLYEKDNGLGAST